MLSILALRGNPSFRRTLNVSLGLLALALLAVLGPGRADAAPVEAPAAQEAGNWVIYSNGGLWAYPTNAYGVAVGPHQRLIQPVGGGNIVLQPTNLRMIPQGYTSVYHSPWGTGRVYIAGGISAYTPLVQPSRGAAGGRYGSGPVRGGGGYYYNPNCGGGWRFGNCR